MNLIVGGTGFIGGHLCEYFFTEGEISKGIFRKGSHLRIMDQCGVQCLEADLLDRHTLHEPLDMVDVVYNLASPKPESQPAEYLRFNNEGLRNLLEESKEHGVKVFVHLSPLEVYGFRRQAIDDRTVPAPTNQYQQAKLEAERLVQEFGRKNPGIKVRIVRAAKAVGPRDKELAVPILRMMRDGKTVLPAGCSSRMSFTHPKDIAQALFKSSNSAEQNDPYLIKSFDASPEELTATLARLCGQEITIKKQGFFSGKSAFSGHVVEEIKAGLILSEQASWKGLNYVPSYDIDKVAAEVASWYRKEPWVVEDQT